VVISYINSNLIVGLAKTRSGSGLTISGSIKDGKWLFKVHLRVGNTAYNAETGKMVSPKQALGEIGKVHGEYVTKGIL